MDLSVLAFNLKRVMNIVGCKELLAETLRLVRRPRQRGRRQSTALRSSAVEFSHGLSGSPLSRFPVEALTSEAVRIAVQRVIDRRPSFYEQYQYDKVIRLPGI